MQQAIDILDEMIKEVHKKVKNEFSEEFRDTYTLEEVKSRIQAL